MHFWLLLAWVVFQSAILYNVLLSGVGPCWIMGLSSPRPSLCSLRGLVSIFLSYHSAISAVILIDSILLASLGLPFISLPMTQCVHWVFSYIVCGLLCPISSWASLAHLLSLGFLDPFPILLSHGPLLTLLDFLGPITLYLILGANGSSISPLLSLLALLRACCGPFLFFYILPMGLILLSFRAHSNPFASSGPTL